MRPPTTRTPYHDHPAFRSLPRLVKREHGHWYEFAEEKVTFQRAVRRKEFDEDAAKIVMKTFLEPHQGTILHLLRHGPIQK